MIKGLLKMYPYGVIISLAFLLTFGFLIIGFIPTVIVDGSLLLTVIAVFISIGLSYLAFQRSFTTNLRDQFERVGGVIPSKRVNQLIEHYYHVCSGERVLFPLFSHSPKHSKKLEKLLQDKGYKVYYSVDIFKQITSCTIADNGITTTGYSINKEMSLCIAFLKLCGEKID